MQLTGKISFEFDFSSSLLYNTTLSVYIWLHLGGWSLYAGIGKKINLQGHLVSDAVLF